MHAFCAWGRALWHAAPWALGALHRVGWAPALAMAAGRVARALGECDALDRTRGDIPFCPRGRARPGRVVEQVARA